MTGREVRTVAEERLPGELPIWSHPDWAERFPWLVQGVTGAGTAEEPFDLGLFGQTPVGEAIRRWRRLGERLGIPAMAHSHQLHGAEVRVHEESVGDGLLVLHGYDGHVARTAGLLLTASVADCVPVSLVDPRTRTVGIVHAGWRGVAAGVLGRALGLMVERFGADPAEMRMHAGPSICADCYEVGPEVHAAVHPDRAPPGSPTPIDLRDALAGRAIGHGLSAEHITRSAHCTRCGPGEFFSHRAGARARQMGFIAVRTLA